MATITIHEHPGLEEATLHGIELPDGTTLWEREPGDGRVPLGEYVLKAHGQDQVVIPSGRGYSPSGASSWSRWLEGYRKRLTDLGVPVTAMPRLVARRVTLIVSSTYIVDTAAAEEADR